MFLVVAVAGELTIREKAAVAIFKIPTATAAVPATEPASPEVSFFQRAQKQGEEKKRRRIEKSIYRSTEHVSATSNICERLFSAAKLIMTDLRKNMDPDTLNMILFLKANKNLWAEKVIIDEIIANFAAAGETIYDYVAQGTSDVNFLNAFCKQLS